ETAGAHRGSAGGITFLRSAELNVVEVVAFVARAVDSVRRKQERADVFYRSRALLHGPCLVQRQRPPAALFTRGVAHRRGLSNDDGVRSETAEQSRDGAIEARNDGSDTDHCSSADDHSENCEEGPELVRSNRIQCQPNSGK